MFPLFLLIAVAAVAVAASSSKSSPPALPPPSGGGTTPPPAGPAEGPPANIRSMIVEGNWTAAGAPPASFTEQDAWLAHDCQSYAIGKQWVPTITTMVNGEAVEMTAGEYYTALVNSPLHPDESPGWPNDTPLRMFAARAIDELQDRWEHEGFSVCQLSMPLSKDYEAVPNNFEPAVDAVLTKRGFAALWDYVLEQAHEEMEDALEAKYGSAGTASIARHWAERVRALHPEMSTDDKTDWAYEQGFVIRNRCPDRIVPSNPAHDECKEIWIEIFRQVEEAGG